MHRIRNTIITIFVITWCLAFHYESVRHFYLNPLFGRELPKIKILFPPAGWIMFFQVDEGFGYTQIFGYKDGKLHEIDPHEVFRVRTVGFDNIRRGVIYGAALRRDNRPFCRQLKRRFPAFDKFQVIYHYYPKATSDPLERISQVAYVCTGEE
jgi:hypothetical protein